MSAVGEVFARRYELLDPIAEGGMGAVWRVYDLVEDDVKAAKLLRQSDAGSLLRFMREQTTRIQHPHVVTPVSWVGEDDSVLFTMPLVRGGSVATLIGDWGPLPEAWVAEIVDQTLDALGAVHDAGIVHRDVKPANLLLEPTGSKIPHVRLTDFGIAVATDQPRLTMAATAVGTPGYMAPEQKAGADPDPVQDLYAVATVGLEMLAGHPPPFEDGELSDSPLAGLFHAVRNPDPTRRPATAADMRGELQGLKSETWQPGEVEVLDHFADDTAAEPAPDATPTAVLGHPEPKTVVDAETRAESTPEPPTPPEPTSNQPSAAPVVALALVGIALLVVALLLVF